VTTLVSCCLPVPIFACICVHTPECVSTRSVHVLCVSRVHKYTHACLQTHDLRAYNAYIHVTKRTYTCKHTHKHTTDALECIIGTHNCAPQASCSNLQGSFACACNTGWNSLQQGTECEDIDECGSAAHPCSERIATCVNTLGSFFCSCNVGYNGSGLAVCQDVDECLNKSHACHVFASCANTVGSYLCTCNVGFNNTAPNVCENIDECSVGNHSCGPNATCNDTVGSFVCECLEPGWPYLAPDLRNCLDRDECSLKVHDCHDNALCSSECFWRAAR
jgi:hypothetical protein